MTVCGNEIKIGRYADDTTMILDASKKILYICLTRPRAFRCNIWLTAQQIHVEKQILWIGACAGRLSRCGIVYKIVKECHRKPKWKKKTIFSILLKTS